MSEYEDGYWESADGLKLHYRRYAGRPQQGEALKAPPLPILCLHGLSRNARDFESLSDHLADRGHDVLVPEMRGRGDSEPAREIADYDLRVYVADVELLLARQGWERFIAIGTSMGGLMTMALAAADAGRIAGAVINDIGPELNLAGLRRIANSIGGATSYPTWVHAARDLMAQHGALYPDWTLADWIANAKRRLRLSPSGKIGSDYDPRIAQAFTAPEALADADAWDAWLTFKPVPLVLIRGELSDLLTDPQAEVAIAALDSAELVTVPRVGHAPLLDEPEARAAIDSLIDRVEAAELRG